MRRAENGDDLTNAQYKPNWNCHYEFTPLPPYNKHILIKKKKKKKNNVCRGVEEEDC
jgi:hypothetical protein